MPGLLLPFTPSVVFEDSRPFGAEEYAGRRAGENSQAVLNAEERSERRAAEGDPSLALVEGHPSQRLSEAHLTIRDAEEG